MQSEEDRKENSINDYENLLITINDPMELKSELQKVYHESYRDYVECLLEKRTEESNTGHTTSVAEGLVHAFTCLDNDMSREALDPPKLNDDDQKKDAYVRLATRTAAMSGACAVVAHIDSNELHVASTGDCSAVIGALSQNDRWVPIKLNQEHHEENKNEVQRIISEHPGENPKHVIKGGRLLGMLQPLRAFGDFRFKWTGDITEEIFGSVLGRDSGPGTKKPPNVPPNLKTPPYLTAVPEVTSHKLSRRDKFLVLATDGLWETMTPNEVVRLVGEHLMGKVTLKPLEIDHRHNYTLSEINLMLRHRKAAMKLKPKDTNAATHLIRHALGGSSYDPDHKKMSEMLSAPQDIVRTLRDDITISVIFFDTEYLTGLVGSEAPHSQHGSFTQ